MVRVIRPNLSVVRNELGRDPLDGDIYVFINRRRTQIRLLMRHLEWGTVELPGGDGRGTSLVWSDLMLIVEVIALGSVRRRLRYGAKEKTEKRA